MKNVSVIVLLVLVLLSLSDLNSVDLVRVVRYRNAHRGILLEWNGHERLPGHPRTSSNTVELLSSLGHQ